jgi:hypothetical protein
MISFKTFLKESISPTFITHIEQMKPLEFLSLVKTLDSEYKGLLNLNDISITEKIDGTSLTIGQDSSGKTFMNTKMSHRYFNVGDFTNYAISKGYKTDINKKFDNILKNVQADKKLQRVLSKHNRGNGIVIVGEILYVPFATEVENDRLQFIFMDYDRANLGSEWTFVPFDVQDFDGNSIGDKERIFKDLYTISTAERKYTNANLNVSGDIDITLSISDVKKNVLDKYDNIDTLIKSRKKVDKPLKDKIKSEIGVYQRQLSNQILSYVESGKFGDDFEGIVLKMKSGTTLKATSPRFKKRRAELKDIKFNRK